MKKIFAIAALILAVGACSGRQTVLNDNEQEPRYSSRGERVVYDDRALAQVEDRRYYEGERTYYADEARIPARRYEGERTTQVVVEREAPRYKKKVVQYDEPRRRSRYMEDSYIEDNNEHCFECLKKAQDMGMFNRSDADIVKREVLIKEKSADYVTYEYKDVRVDEISRLADRYCAQNGKKAYLRDSVLNKDFSRKAVFDCLDMQ